MEPQIIFITNSIPSGSAFGVLANTGENVFIPPNVSNSIDLQVGEERKAIIIPNSSDMSHKTPWFAVKILPLDDDNENVVKLFPERTEEETRRLSPEQVDDSIMEVLENYDEDFFSAADLAEETGIDKKTVGNSCMRLFNAGRISKADVYSRVGQSRPTMCLWAVGIDCFNSFSDR